MSKPVVMTFKGMNNVADRASLKSGEHVMLLNVDVDTRGNVTLRDELENVSATPTHSLFSANGMLFGVQNSSLRLLTGATSTELYPLSNNNPVSYARCSNDYIIFSNGTDIGYIYSGSATALSEVESSIPITATGTTVDILKSKLPAGELVEFFSGRIYSGKGGQDGCIIHYTDAFEMHTDEVENYLQLIGMPTLLMATDDTLWVSNGQAIFAFIGTDPDDMQEIQKASYPAVIHTAVAYNANAMGLEGITGKVIVVTTTQGICMLANGGHFINLSQDVVSLPQAFSGAAGIIESKGIRRYINCLTSTDGSYNSFPIKEPLYD